MSYSELVDWSINPFSYEASLSREPIKRNLFILKLNKSQWNLSVARKAMKTIRYLSRAKGIKSRITTEIDTKSGYSRNERALKNWAYDVKK